MWAAMGWGESVGCHGGGGRVWAAMGGGGAECGLPWGRVWAALGGVLDGGQKEARIQ